MIEINRLVDVLRSLERTLGTHILALSANLRQNRVGGPPGGPGAADKKGVRARTTVINEITRHGEENEAFKGGDEKEAHHHPGEGVGEAVAEPAAALKKVRPSRFRKI